MPALSEFPNGDTLFVDANILLSHFLGQQSSCTTFLERIWTHQVSGVTSVVVLSEMRHRLMRAEVAAKQGIPTKRALRFLQEHPEVIAHLTESRRALSELRQWPLRVVHLTRGQFWQACRLSERYGLLTHDACHLAVMRAQRLRHLASADEDFRSVPHLTLWTP